VCDLEKEEKGPQGQCEYGRSGGKEWEWAEEEGRCEYEFLLFGRIGIPGTTG
jgi:hypothetical protein